MNEKTPRAAERLQEAAEPWDSARYMAPDPSLPIEKQLQWHQVCGHVLLLNCSERTRRAAAAEADREIATREPAARHRLAARVTELETELTEARRENTEIRELAHNVSDLRAIDDLTRERDQHAARITELEAVSAQLDRKTKYARALEGVTAAWAHSMYAAHIDCVRGDVKPAISFLAEALDGFEGPEWNGTETGAEWLERTAAPAENPAIPE
jgi:hypothetical protein